MDGGSHPGAGVARGGGGGCRSLPSWRGGAAAVAIHASGPWIASPAARNDGGAAARPARGHRLAPLIALSARTGRAPCARPAPALRGAGASHPPGGRRPCPERCAGGQLPALRSRSGRRAGRGGAPLIRPGAGCLAASPPSLRGSAASAAIHRPGPWIASPTPRHDGGNSSAPRPVVGRGELRDKGANRALAVTPGGMPGVARPEDLTHRSP